MPDRKFDDEPSSSAEVRKPHAGAVVSRPARTFDHLLACSARYALGRRSYVVGYVCDEIERRLYEDPPLGENFRESIIEDIERALEDERQGLVHEPLGMAGDRERWLRLLAALQKARKPT